jgi:hypothetical protein
LGSNDQPAGQLLQRPADECGGIEYQNLSHEPA